MEALFAFWDPNGTMRPISHKLPYRDDSKWRKRLDIREWITTRTQEGEYLANTVDELFNKSVQRPKHPNVFVTLGVCMLRQSLILTHRRRRVHTLFASTYWDEQGYIMSQYLGDETNEAEIKATLHYFAVLSINNLNTYAKEVLN
jgi:hypothetical protein